MKGTEKQIAWANEIRANVIKSLEFIKAHSPASVQAEAQKRIDRLNEKNVDAGDIIDIFKDIHFGADEMKNAREVHAAYRVTLPYTSSGKYLLCMEANEN